jgi:uncharacterized membrane protein
MAEGGNTKTGMTENMEGLLCYVFGWLSGIIFFVVEKDNKFVKFHAMQSIIFTLGLMIANIVLGIIPVIGWTVALILNLVCLVVWIILMIKAYKGEKYKLPYIGDMAEKQAG